MFVNACGGPANAVCGFVRMLQKWLNDFRPTHVAIIFDSGRSPWRVAIWPQYKTGRPPRPAEMEAQVPDIRSIVSAMGLVIVERANEEADDVIAMLARNSSRAGAKVYIASNDKDFTQIVTANVHIIHSGRKGTKIVDQEAVVERYGVSPTQMVDFLSLVGDDTDDIPGVPGVGEKTAADLLSRFGSLDGLLQDLDQISSVKVRSSLFTWSQQIQINQRLIRLESSDAGLPRHVDLIRGQSDTMKLEDLFRKYGLGEKKPNQSPNAQSNLDLFPSD